MLSCIAFWISEEEGLLSQPVSKTAKDRAATVENLFIFNSLYDFGAHYFAMDLLRIWSKISHHCFNCICLSRIPRSWGCPHVAYEDITNIAACLSTGSRSNLRINTESKNLLFAAKAILKTPVFGTVWG